MNILMKDQEWKTTLSSIVPGLFVRSQAGRDEDSNIGK